MGNDIGHHIGDNGLGVPEVRQWNLKHQACRVQYKDDEISVKVLCTQCAEEACRDGFTEGEHKCRRGDDISWDKPWNTTCGRTPLTIRNHFNDNTKLFCYDSSGADLEKRCGDALAANDENYFDCVKNVEYHGTCLPEVNGFPWNIGAGWIIIPIVICICCLCGWQSEKKHRAYTKKWKMANGYEYQRQKRLDIGI
jgi:hypothetical protein